MKMKRYVLFLLGLAVLLFASCVPTKDLIYLQKKDSSTIDSVAVNPVASKPYRLQTNDIISISIKAIDPKLVVMFNPTGDQPGSANKSESGLFFDGFTVDDHGSIRIPILGQVEVIGHTLEEVRVIIEKKLLEEYFNREADIFVTVKLAGFRYTINGEITQPGTKLLFQEKVNILEAVANAGDITITGNRKAVTVIRQYPHGTEMHDIDLTDINAMKSPYYYLQPNDYIYVKPLPQKSWGTGTTGLQSLSTIITVISLLTTTLILLRQ